MYLVLIKENNRKILVNLIQVQLILQEKMTMKKMK